MRLIAKHQEVGYITPQQRPSCRNCGHCGAGEENGLGQVFYIACRKHGIEVRAGGICNDHPRIGEVSMRRPVSPNRGLR